jgi:Alkylmercury lyase
MLERTVEEDALLALAFNELLASPEPVTVSHLAQQLKRGEIEIEARVAHLAERGWVRRDEDGAVVGSRGLSIEPTRHELDLPQGLRYTWCAYDTVGIFGALAVSGTIRSRTPLGEPVELEVEDGRPTDSDGIVLFFPQRQVSSVVDEWCPLANFFLDGEEARSWTSERGVEGEVLTLEQASARGAAEWRRLLD